MKQNEFRAFPEPPIHLPLNITESSKLLPEKGKILEGYGDEKRFNIADLSIEKQQFWTLLSAPSSRYIDRKTLFFIHEQHPKINAVIAKPIPLQSSFSLKEPQLIAINDLAVEDLRNRIDNLSNASEKVICDWMTEEFLMEPLVYKKYPVLFVGVYSTNTDIERAGGFSIIGKSYIAGLKRTSENTLTIERLRKRTRKVPYLGIWEGEFSFTLDTQRAKIKSPAFQQQFEERRLDPSAFLNIWKLYLELDTKRINLQQEAAGSLVYQEFKALKEGSKRRIFYLKKGEKKSAINFVEVLKEFPDDQRIVAIESQSKFNSTQLRFKFIEFEESQNAIIAEQNENQYYQTPKKGLITLSLFGWKIANERRENAFYRIIDEKCDIRSLYYHLYEMKLDKKVSRSTLTIRESQIVKAFGNDIPNAKQKDAVRVCLESPDIALIQGPPGTGKTKVIGALQNLLGHQQRKMEALPSILLTSYQHDAVDNMAQKTRIFGLPPYRYGSKNRQQGEQGFDEWRKEITGHLNKQIIRLESSPLLCDLRELKKDVIRLKYSSIPPTAYFELFKTVIERCRKKHSGIISLETMLSLERIYKKVFQNRQSISPGTLSLRRKIWALRTTHEGYSDDGILRLHSLVNYLESQKKLNTTIAILDSSLIDALIKIADKSISISDNFLKKIRKLKWLLLEDLMADPLWQKNNLGFKELQAVLNKVTEDINSTLKSIPEGKADIIENFLDVFNSNSLDVKETIAHYNYVYATTTQKSGAKQFLDVRSSHIKHAEDNASGFDYVIIDEAARANPLDLFIPMALAQKKIILVGDHKQLPHLLEPDIEKDMQKNTEKINNQNDSNFDIIEALKISLFKKIWEYFLSKPDGLPRTVSLKKQYRMHPKLGKFISKVFYEPDVEIMSGRKECEFEHTVNRYKNKYAIWENCSAEAELRGGTGWYRPLEAEKIVSLAVEILENSDESLGIITMYRAQEREILRRLEDEGIIIENDIIDQYSSRFRIGTVDSFQGREFDVVLLSPVRSNSKQAKSIETARMKFGFLTFRNRLNVALSRQRKLLIVVGNRSMYQTEEAKQYVEGLYEFNKMCQGV